LGGPAPCPEESVGGGNGGILGGLLLMTIKEAIQKAIRTGDAHAVGIIADQLRFKWGMNYQETFEFFKGVCPDLVLPEFETLLYESEEIYG